MSRDFPESDWKILRELSRVALDRFCDRVLDEIREAAGDSSKSSHERYRTIYRLIHDRDRELADAFDNLRRSSASRQLLLMVDLGLITDEEMSRSSEATQQMVKSLLG